MMIPTRVLLLAPIFLAASLFSPGIRAQAPDNSSQNKTQSVTADNQSNAKSDRLITAEIRKAIMADKGLSTYAHNVKIIVLNGSVTLKGPVHSDTEKQKVLADVGSVVAAGQIADQLTIKQ